MRILGIETSCDETAAAVLEFEDTKRRGYEDTKGIPVRIISNIVHSQIATHRRTGGVVPEVAAREHVQKIIPVVEKALAPLNNPPHPRIKCGAGSNPLPKGRGNIRVVDAIAVTYGPGLITSLIVGLETARTLSWAWNVPVVAVNHMEGHISAAYLQRKSEIRHRSVRGPAGSGGMLRENPKSEIPEAISYKLEPISYPALALVVSGGHTELVLMRKPLSYQIIGATRDDAVGEAFDKVAKILGLEYPGGPVVSRLAESGDPTVFPFSPPMIKSPDYDFSFSGIKTAVLYTVRDLQSSLRPCLGWGSNRHPGLDPESIDSGSGAGMTITTRNDLCASFQKAVVEVLVAKTIRAAKEYKAKTVILAGGVAANEQLREQLGLAIQERLPLTTYSLPLAPFCTDNAVMIAIAGYFHAKKKQFTPWQKLDVDPNLVLGVDNRFTFGVM